MDIAVVAETPTHPDRWWTVAAYAYALLLGGITSYFLLGIPVQLSDSFGNLIQIQSKPIGRIFLDELRGGGYLRPLLQVQLKIVYDLARGDYFHWYRGVQAAQVIGVLVLAVRLVRVRTAVDAAVAMLCLAIVLGMHTFTGTIREAFPINTFLTLVLCCLAAAVLAQSRGGRVIDVVSLVLLIFSLLTLETGILVWVLFAAAWAAGHTGVSRRGMFACTVTIVLYLAFRFVALHGGTPGLAERPAGFGFNTLEPGELVARFGSDPLPFYAYNVLSAVLDLLFAEPRGGVWVLLRDMSLDALQPWHIVNVVSSTLTTLVIASYVANRFAAWRRREITADDQLVLLFLALVPSNAFLCFAYSKDVILSPAGVFYALAAFVAIRDLVMRPRPWLSSRRGRLAIVGLAVVATGWSVRLVGIHYLLRSTAGTVRTEWAFVDDWEERNRVSMTRPEAARLKETLYADAIWRHPESRRLALRWGDRWFDTQ